MVNQLPPQESTLDPTKLDGTPFPLQVASDRERMASMRSPAEMVQHRQLEAQLGAQISRRQENLRLQAHQAGIPEKVAKDLIQAGHQGVLRTLIWANAKKSINSDGTVRKGSMFADTAPLYSDFSNDDGVDFAAAKKKYDSEREHLLHLRPSNLFTVMYPPPNPNTGKVDPPSYVLAQDAERQWDAGWSFFVDEADERPAPDIRCGIGGCEQVAYGDYDLAEHQAARHGRQLKAKLEAEARLSQQTVQEGILATNKAMMMMLEQMQMNKVGLVTPAQAKEEAAVAALDEAPAKGKG